MMKVLMVISQFHPIIGGAERQAKLLAQKLIQKGIEVNILTGWWKLKTPRREVIDGIKVFRNFTFWGMFGVKGIRVLSGLIYMLSLGVYLFIHRREYDLIHVHQALYPAFISVLIGKRVLGKPVIVKTASSGMTSDIKGLSRFPLGRFQLKYLLKHMDVLVAISQITGQEYKDIGFSETKIRYIPNGVEIPDKGKTSEKGGLQVLSIARLSREKGVDVLLKAWGEVLQEENSLRLTIVGDGPLYSEMKRISQSLRIEERVEFSGIVYDVEAYWRLAEIFVLPSRTEGMSNALLEAMSHGIPCIATNVGGNGELLKGGDEEISFGGYGIAKNGLLVNPDDAKGLKEAMLYFIRNKRVREEMGSRSRKFVQENYSIDWVADRYIDLYRSILEQR